MEAALACPENIVNGGAILLCVLDALVKGVVFLRGALAPSEVAMVVGAGQKAHACIFGVSIVDRKPAGDGFTGSERPIAGVLMPRHAFAVPGHFAKKMGSPTDNLRPKQILHTGNDARVGEKIINAAIFQMSGANGVAVTTFSDGLLKKAIKVAAQIINFGTIEYTDGLDKSVFVKVSNIFTSECCRFRDGTGMKTQVTLCGVNCTLIRDNFKLSHWNYRKTRSGLPLDYFT